MPDIQHENDWLCLYSDLDGISCSLWKMASWYYYLGLIGIQRDLHSNLPTSSWTNSCVGVTISIAPCSFIFPSLLILKQRSTVEYHVDISQVASQHGCGDTCEISTWLNGSIIQSCNLPDIHYGWINERSLSSPHPRAQRDWWTNTVLRVINHGFCLYNEPMIDGLWIIYTHITTKIRPIRGAHS